MLRFFRGFPAVALFWAASFASAQDFRVYTRIYDGRTPAHGGKRSVAPRTRTTTLFHAAKVYDSVDDLNQMTIFEPAHERFVMVDGSRRLATVVPFSFIEDRIHRAEQQAEQKLSELRASGRPQETRLAEQLQFQLHPVFQESFSDEQRSLRLLGRPIAYSLRCAPAESNERLNAYLEYADWAARLNFVLYPNAQFPAPRLEVNNALRRRRLLPVEVALEVLTPNGQHKTAEHQYTWKLDAEDRNRIHHWETLRRDRTIKEVSLEDYLRFDAGAVSGRGEGARRESTRPGAGPRNQAGR